MTGFCRKDSDWWALLRRLSKFRPRNRRSHWHPLLSWYHSGSHVRILSLPRFDSPPHRMYILGAIEAFQTAFSFKSEEYYPNKVFFTGLLCRPICNGYGAGSSRAVLGAWANYLHWSRACKPGCILVFGCCPDFHCRCSGWVVPVCRVSVQVQLVSVG